MLATNTWSTERDLGSNRTLAGAFAVASLLMAFAFSLAILYKPAPKAAATEKSVEVTFVQELAPPPPPPPPAPIVRAPAPAPAAAAPVVPKHLKKIVVDKVKVKPLAAPVKIVKGAPAEADPALDRGVEVAGLGEGDPAGLEGGAVGAEAMPLPERASPPKPLGGNAVPSFPVAAREAGKEGLVVLRLIVGTDGRVEDVEVLKGEEPFIAVAVDTVRGWRYRPAMQNGLALRVQHIVRIPFQLRA